VRILPRIRQIFEKVRLDARPAEAAHPVDRWIPFKNRTIGLHAAFSFVRQIASFAASAGAPRHVVGRIALQSQPLRRGSEPSDCIRVRNGVRPE
jgi:hypothetical protein